jgi:xylulokinase
MYLGLDSSTQSLSAVVIHPESGKPLAQSSINFGAELPQFHSPSGFIPGAAGGEVHADPRMWLEAMDLLFLRLSSEIDLSSIRLVAGSGQQHGSVYLDATFPGRVASLDPLRALAEQISPALTRRTSPIWMDTSTASQCREITQAAGGAEEVCRRSGSIAIERFTGPQIRRFYQNDPEAYARTARVHLVSSFLASVLSGRDASIDHGDGAGMNLLNLAALGWDEVLTEATAPGLMSILPGTAPATRIIGTISDYFVAKYGFSPECRCAHFTGDNPASLVGMGATTPGNVVVSLGTSDTFFAAMPEARTDPNGFGHVFGNPLGGYMSLICFRNGSLAREALRDELGVDWSAFDQAAMETSLHAAGRNLMLPFYGPEITPRGDFHGPVRKGDPSFESGGDPSLQIRALLEGQFLNMRLHSRWMNVTTERLLLTGGASRNNGIAQIAADVFQAPVERLDISNSAALGAALIAAIADGCSASELQDSFCRPSAGSKLTPNRDLAGAYSEALDAFASLLAESL